MTLAEVDRATQSRARVEEIRAKQKATFDYVLADLIGRSIGRIYSSNATFPDISTVYPSLFNAEDIEEKRQEQIAEASAIRFKQFVNFHNSKF